MAATGPARFRACAARRPGPLLLPLLALLAAAVAAEQPAEAAPEAVESPPRSVEGPSGALERGNRLFREGRLEEAAEAYLEGYRPGAVHPTLAYNLGTALHQLGRLPEAVLWYRRAGQSEDPWLEDNLWLARRTLGSRTLPPAGLLGRLAPRAALLQGLGVALAWLGLLLLAARRSPVWATAGAFLLAAACYGSAEAARRLGPRQGVLLADCRAGATEIPAGSEAWVRRLPEGGWQVAEGVSCPPGSVELISPLP